MFHWSDNKTQRRGTSICGPNMNLSLRVLFMINCIRKYLMYAESNVLIVYSLDHLFVDKKINYLIKFMREVSNHQQLWSYPFELNGYEEHKKLAGMIKIAEHLSIKGRYWLGEHSRNHFELHSARANKFILLSAELCKLTIFNNKVCKIRQLFIAFRSIFKGVHF